MCVKTGLLYVGAEFGDHQLYQFQGIGDDEGAIEARSVNDPELGDDSVSASQVAPVFKPTPLKNLVLVDESESAAPTTDRTRSPSPPWTPSRCSPPCSWAWSRG